MRTLYIECKMGAAGDMLMASLYELLEDKQGFLDTMNGLGLPGVRLEAQKSSSCGIAGTHMKVTVHGEEEQRENDRRHPGGGDELTLQIRIDRRARIDARRRRDARLVEAARTQRQDGEQHRPPDGQIDREPGDRAHQ